MNELALFAGAGGGILGGTLLGWRTRCAVELDAFCRSVLLRRQADGVLPRFPVWDDVRTFDGRPWAGKINVISAGFPCQDISSAGAGAGIDGERSGLWREVVRIATEIRPQFIFVENSPLLVGRGLVRVLADLAEMGFDAWWGIVGAADVGAPHRRERCWVVAHAQCSERRPELRSRNGMEREREDGVSQWEEGSSRAGACCETLDNTMRRRHGAQDDKVCAGRVGIEHASWWLTEPDVGRVANGVAARVDRLKAIGNGQVPLVAATAWRILTHNVELTGAKPVGEASGSAQGYAARGDNGE